MLISAIKFLKLILQINLFLISTSVFSITHDEQLKITSQALQNLEQRYPHVKLVGISHFNHFISHKVEPYVDTEKYSHQRLNEITKFYINNKTPSIVTFNELIEAVNLYFNFAKPENSITIIIDGENEKRILYKSMMYYGIGLLFQTQYLSNTDLSHFNELNVLKKLLLKNLSLYFGMGGGGPGSLSPWENFIFKYLYAIHANFPADMVAEASNSLSAIVSNQKIEKYQRAAASEILLELALLCNAKCTSPSIEFTSIANRPKEDYIKTVFWNCERNCHLSNLNPGPAGFYDEYLRLLKRINDKGLDELREKLILQDWKHSLISAKSNFSNIFLNKATAWHFTKDVLSSLWKFFYLTFAITLSWPLWLAFILLGSFLLLFTGNMKIVWPQRRFFFTTSKRLYLRLFGTLLGYVLYPLQILKKIYITLKNNSIASIKENGHYSYSIGVNSFVVSVTLLITDIKIYVDLNY